MATVTFQITAEITLPCLKTAARLYDDESDDELLQPLVEKVETAVRVALCAIKGAENDEVTVEIDTVERED